MISDQRSSDPAAALVEPSDMANEQIEKVNARVKFKEGTVELPSLELARESNEDSGAGIGGPSYSSGSSYTEKNDISNIHLVDKLRSRTGDVSGFPPSQKLDNEKQNQNAPKTVPIQYAETAGIVLVLVLVFGLVDGSLLAQFLCKPSKAQ